MKKIKSYYVIPLIYSLILVLIILTFDIIIDKNTEGETFLYRMVYIIENVSTPILFTWIGLTLVSAISMLIYYLKKRRDLFIGMAICFGINIIMMSPILGI